MYRFTGIDGREFIVFGHTFQAILPDPDYPTSRSILHAHGQTYTINGCVGIVCQAIKKQQEDMNRENDHPCQSPQDSKEPEAEDE